MNTIIQHIQLHKAYLTVRHHLLQCHILDVAQSELGSDIHIPIATRC